MDDVSVTLPLSKYNKLLDKAELLKREGRVFSVVKKNGDIKVGNHSLLIPDIEYMGEQEFISELKGVLGNINDRYTAVIKQLNESLDKATKESDVQMSVMDVELSELRSNLAALEAEYQDAKDEIMKLNAELIKATTKPIKSTLFTKIKQLKW